MVVMSLQIMTENDPPVSKIHPSFIFHNLKEHSYPGFPPFV